MTIEEARDLLSYIPVAKCGYQDWVNVGMALHAEGLPSSVWDEWSRNDSRYHAGECERKWHTFGNGSTQVTMGTVYHMAQQYGFKPAKAVVYGWEDYITNDGDGREGWHGKNTEMQLPYMDESTYDPKKDIRDYLTTLFDKDDIVCYVTQAYQDEDGKFKPYGGAWTKTCGRILKDLDKYGDDMDSAFGTINQDAGVWVCFNPMDGSGRSNKNVKSFKYALVESDDQDIDTQYALIQDLNLPVKMLVHSGGKSLHAIVSINAQDANQYAERVNKLYEICINNGLKVDTQDKNPARLSRMPGFRRGDKWQYIVAKNIGAADFEQWERQIANLSEPLDVINLEAIWDKMPPLKPELIHGILRRGHKMMLASASKAGKTFALVELAIAIAEGRPWLGYQCEQGRVLYLNMELDEASFDHRFMSVYGASGINERHTGNIDIVHLRGQMEPLEKLVPRILRTMKGTEYAAVILDPIYKLGIGDENAADQITTFCNQIDRIANTGASVIYAHHHSKGQQGAKASMDRASGSGVFARDADALLDMIQLEIPYEQVERVGRQYGVNATAWRLESTLREFAYTEPVNLFFTFPRHLIDADGLLNSAKLMETQRSMAYGREVGNAVQTKNKNERKEALIGLLTEDMFGGEYRTVKEYADELGISEKTVKRYVMEEGYCVAYGGKISAV